MEWLIANWSEVIQTILAVLGAASLIAKLTPSKMDDNIICKIINYVGLAKTIKK